MYKNGEQAIERILELVAKCPKEYQESCFEVLLAGYVRSDFGDGKQPQASGQQQGQQGQQGQGQQSTPPSETSIPATVLPRFKALAKRIGVTLDKLEALFDFNVEIGRAH